MTVLEIVKSLAESSSGPELFTMLSLVLLVLFAGGYAAVRISGVVQGYQDEAKRKQSQIDEIARMAATAAQHIERLEKITLQIKESTEKLQEIERNVERAVDRYHDVIKIVSTVLEKISDLQQVAREIEDRIVSSENTTDHTAELVRTLSSSIQGLNRDLSVVTGMLMNQNVTLPFRADLR